MYSTSSVLAHISGFGGQPLSIVYKATVSLRETSSVVASPLVLGLKGEDSEWVRVNIANSEPSENDWIGVFSPARFNSSTCPVNNPKDQAPYICSTPIKFMFANRSNSQYTKTGKSTLNFQP